MPHDVLDTRGLRCPVPANRTRDRLKALPAGAILEVLGDDPLFVLDVRALLEREGHAYLGHGNDAGGGVRLTLRKAG